MVELQLDSVLAHELAVREVWIGVDTSLRSLEVLVEEIQAVVIVRLKLGCVDLGVTEDASCLPNTGHKSGADV